MVRSDRRSARRFDVPDSGLRLHAGAGRTTNHVLVDFSHNSARFVSHRALEPEQDLVFDLTTSGYDISRLKGFVVRVDNADEFQKNFYVVIKFYPFSTLEKYHSLDNYQTLKSLITELEMKGPDPRVR